ncbi:hypothetical protein [Paraburkholderia caballeronis]|uniref:hypothetical protein n=1 Tax=Paraburkholderia caballeronis TaxID=416943 RepID=UPI00106504FC|nr:hypothetical protein [Paraburkholderia caballeronis]TDV04668.1 hypothetical protein C7408_13130 [Paraburkholderia caballeronis]TDV07911.1 hypothetical protein C7406_13330 [Paraburkholderia caballeronis]TDV18202.1 hypothetical protein C7404_13130 [Paraburkholderia caballeronis]
MNVKAGDLAIVVVPASWPRKTLDGKIVEVMHFVPPRGPGAEWDQRPMWWCVFQSPWFNYHGRMFTEGPMLHSWLRPISGVPVTDEVDDEVAA